MSKFSESNWNRYVEGFILWNVFLYKFVFPKCHPSCLNELKFKENIFSLIKLLTISWAVFMSLLIVLNNKKNIHKVSKHYYVNNAMYYEWIMKI